MSQSNKIGIINTKITKLGDAEKITKKLLGELSRDILEYVVIDESWDSDAINRLLNVLTPVNRGVARLFFETFTPFIVEEGVFLGMPKDKKEKQAAKIKATTAVTEFLFNEDNTLWTWAATEVEPPQLAKPLTLDQMMHYIERIASGKANKGNIDEAAKQKASEFMTLMAPAALAA